MSKQRSLCERPIVSLVTVRQLVWGDVVTTIAPHHSARSHASDAAQSAGPVLNCPCDRWNVRAGENMFVSYTHTHIHNTDWRSHQGLSPPAFLFTVSFLCLLVHLDPKWKTHWHKKDMLNEALNLWHPSIQDWIDWIEKTFLGMSPCYQDEQEWFTCAFLFWTDTCIYLLSLAFFLILNALRNLQQKTTLITCLTRHLAGRPTLNYISFLL